MCEYSSCTPVSPVDGKIRPRYVSITRLVRTSEWRRMSNYPVCWIMDGVGPSGNDKGKVSLNASFLPEK